MIGVKRLFDSRAGGDGLVRTEVVSGLMLDLCLDTEGFIHARMILHQSYLNVHEVNFGQFIRIYLECSKLHDLYSQLIPKLLATNEVFITPNIYSGKWDEVDSTSIQKLKRACAQSLLMGDSTVFLLESEDQLTNIAFTLDVEQLIKVILSTGVNFDMDEAHKTIHRLRHFINTGKRGQFHFSVRTSLHMRLFGS